MSTLLVMLFALGAPVAAFVVICLVAGVQFVGTFLVSLALLAGAALWLFEVRRLVDKP